MVTLGLVDRSLTLIGKSMPERILIVDDDAVTRDLAARQAMRLGFDTETATDGGEAVHMFEVSGENTFALVLMDVQMPGMDGLEATRKMRAIEQTAARLRTPIIAITANPDRKQCQDSDMDDFLFKPVLLPDLKMMLEKWISKDR
jgi:CheY-like chemotaxis protein